MVWDLVKGLDLEPSFLKTFGRIEISTNCSMFGNIPLMKDHLSFADQTVCNRCGVLTEV